MPAVRRRSHASPEELLAKLTAAAYDVALRHGLKGPFIDVELDLWRSLAGVLREELSAELPADTDALEAVA
jgi:hypothetical protein